MLEQLAQRIEDKSAKLAVIGLGYVGLPVACMFAEAGFQVVGLRRDPAKVAMINRGECPLEGEEPGLAELVARVTAGGRLHATTDYCEVEGADVILIAVETPVEADTHKPAYKALRSALRDLGPHLGQGVMVIIESTIAPGTMARVVQPELEAASGKRVNQDFVLVNCPERVMPGKLLYNIRHLNRVVGASSPEAAAVAVALYRHIVEGELDPVDCITAEIVKTAENAYRDVQIAFANELALVCEDLGADVWQVRELVNKAPFRDVHRPGAGVGGHCIPKDSWLLLANTSPKLRARLIPDARAVNDYMPYHMAEILETALQKEGLALAEARIAVLGYAYLENSDDTRNSPSETLVAHLRRLGSEVVVQDPYVAPYRGDVLATVEGCDAVVVMVAHAAYKALDLAKLCAALRTPILVDGRHVIAAARAREAGLAYYCVGQGRAD